MGFSRFLNCPEWALSTVSVNTLLRLDRLGIPFPTRSPFVPYSVKNVAGNKLLVGDGFPSCAWEYAPTAMTREQWARLKAYIGTGVASAFVYLRTTNDDESAFANYYGVMQLPTLVPVGYNVSAFEPLTIQFTALVAQ